MNLRQPSLRATLNQLTQDLAEAVLGAVRQASATELAAIFGARQARPEVAPRPGSKAELGASEPAARHGKSRPRPRRAQRSRVIATPPREPTSRVEPFAPKRGPGVADAAPRAPRSGPTEGVPSASRPDLAPVDPERQPARPELRWTVNVGEGDQREMGLPQILTAYQAGLVTEETLVWKDGMADWLVVRDVPEIFDAARK